MPQLGQRGCQKHLGSFFSAADAARAFDRATLAIKGSGHEINFPIEDYAGDAFLMKVWLLGVRI